MRKLSNLIIGLLEKRGITGEEDIEEFLSESPQRTYDPFLMLNMEKGVEMVLDAVSRGQRICIYGDYDADGITSTVMMMQMLSRLTDNLFYYIPSRFDEGYGLNMSAVDTVKEKGADMLITVDCGCVSVEEIAYAQRLGMTVLVTDHHTPGDIEVSCPVINPRQAGCEYPFKGLAGCGVVFKFCCALINRTGFDSSMKKRLLDLAAIGTVGDIMPMVDENRTIVKYGLKAIRNSGRKGLCALLSELSINQRTVTEEDIAYSLVPHLNAAGRIKDADTAVELLLSDDDATVKRYVKELVRRNVLRKEIQNDTYEKCLMIASDQIETRKCLVIKCDDAHEGITGIVAGKIKDRYSRPVIIVSPVAEGLRGTGRSVPGIDLFSVLKESEQLFTKFGGHKGACGFTMDEENFGSLFDEVEKTVTRREEEGPQDDPDRQEPDVEIDICDISQALVGDIRMLAPFGPENEIPVFAVRGRPENAVYMGSENEHMRFTLVSDDGSYIKCVLFSKAEKYGAVLSEKRQVCVTGTLKISSWRGNSFIQMVVKDIY